MGRLASLAAVQKRLKDEAADEAKEALVKRRGTRVDMEENGQKAKVKEIHFSPSASPAFSLTIRYSKPSTE